MGEATELIEKEEAEISGGTAGVLVPVSGDEQLIALETMAKNADRMIAAKQKVWSVLLKVAKPGDWTVFEGQGKKKAELGHGGAMRYAAFLGISFTNWSAAKEVGTDDKGNWYRWDYECDCIFAGRTIRVYGRAGSRDKFFGKAKGEFKELHDVNEGDIKIAARRSAMKEGVKTMLGLHHIPPEELEAAGVKMETAGGYSFKNDDQKKAESVDVKTAKITVEKGTQKLTKNNKTIYTIHGTEGDKFDTWSKTDAETAKNVAMVVGVTVSIEYTTNEYGNSARSVVVS